MTGAAGVYTNYKLLTAHHNEVDLWRTKNWTDAIAAARANPRSYPATPAQPPAPPAPPGGGPPGNGPPPPPPGSGPGSGSGGGGGGGGGPSGSGGSSGGGGGSGGPSTGGTGGASGSGSTTMSYAAAAAKGNGKGKGKGKAPDQRTHARYNFRSSTLHKSTQSRVEKPKRPRTYPRPGPVRTSNGRHVWQMDHIVDSRINSSTSILQPGAGQLQYQVRWTGWPADRTWYSAEQFKNAPHPALLEAFHEANMGAAGPPARLTEWLAAAARGATATAHADDNKAAKFWWDHFPAPANVDQWS